MQNKYVIVPVDKASKNIAFVCKSCYIKIILQELGIVGNEGRNTYTHVNIDKNLVIEQHKEFLITNKLISNYSQLPYTHWIPKFHKSPIKFRFIVVSAKSTTKILSKKLCTGFKLVERQHRSMCNKIEEFTGINRMWIIHNSVAILDSINQINDKNKAKDIETFDFSTLFTSFPHLELKQTLTTVINKAFKGSEID